MRRAAARAARRRLSGGPRLVGAERERVLFLLGGPGSGKGTQGARLVDELGLAHLSVGELLRREAAAATMSGDELIAMVRLSLSKGDILPGWVTAGLLARECRSEALREQRDALRRGAASSLAGTLLFDGFPRSLDNVREFEDRVGDARALLHVRCSHDEMMRRVLDRARTSGREDDNAAVMERRLEKYEAETLPVVELYRERGALLEVDGHGTPDEVYARLRAALDPLLREAAGEGGAARK